MSGAEIKNAIIRSVSLDDADRGMLTGWLHLDYGGSGQGFGGHVLFQPFLHKKGEHSPNYAGLFIWRCMEVGGVTRWQDLPGKTVRVRAEHSAVHAIGHIVKDIWFDPRAEFDALTAAWKAAP